MDQFQLKLILALRHELHGLAELSGEETRTKQRLIVFLRKHTSLHIEDEGQWFCAVHSEPDARETVAFRADMDALPHNGGAAHLCGHDGHSAALCGLGLYLENKRLGRNIVLIFQHAEETGAGGAICASALKKHRADRVYAFHNIPGWPEGAVLLREGTFACASRGMTLNFTGAPSHAAYPENGRNPGYAAARVIDAMPRLAQTGYRGLTMATLIGAQIGQKAFGTAAADAEVWLTLRASMEEDLQALIRAIESAARAEAARDGVDIRISFQDVFPATLNDYAAVQRLRAVCRHTGLSCIDVAEPFRWSEDFGYYGAYAKAVLFGIGAGTDWPQLHTEQYAFNDNILPAALTLFASLAISG
jgi:amidohydrolase